MLLLIHMLDYRDGMNMYCLYTIDIHNYTPCKLISLPYYIKLKKVYRLKQNAIQELA